jgi:probable dihydroxyacetone kinase regulator
MPNITKNIMKDSLKKFIAKKPLSKITISDIAEDCNISRMTFYYHFKDIYDLVEWCIVSDAEESTRNRVVTDTWENELITIFTVARMNKDFYLSLFRSMDRELAERYILRYTDAIATRIVEENLGTITSTNENRARLAEYYSHAIMGIICCWAIGGMKDSIEYLSKCLSGLIMGGIAESAKVAYVPEESNEE